MSIIIIIIIIIIPMHFVVQLAKRPWELVLKPIFTDKLFRDIYLYMQTDFDVSMIINK